MYELFTRQDPYTDLDPVQAATQVVSGTAKLKFPENIVHPTFLQVAYKCLDFEADNRPDFQAICETLQTVSLS